MSTQSNRENTICDIRNKIDESLVCIANKFILEERFGVKHKMNSSDVFLLMYTKSLIKRKQHQGGLSNQIESKIKKLVVKYT